MSEADLVHNVCRRQRLTLYNFLRSHVADQYRSKRSLLEEGDSNLVNTMNEERIKELINQEYLYYFKVQYMNAEQKSRLRPLDIYGRTQKRLD